MFRTPLLYRCTQCGYSTRHRVDMRSHIASELKYRPHVCAVCRHRSITLKALRRHISRGAQCGGAGARALLEKDAAMEAMVERRMREAQVRTSYSRSESTLPPPLPPPPARRAPGGHHPARKNPLALRLHKCSQCNYTALKRRHLVTHALRHRPPGYACGGCGARFHYPSEYRRHAPACRGVTPASLVQLVPPSVRQQRARQFSEEVTQRTAAVVAAEAAAVVAAAAAVQPAMSPPPPQRSVSLEVITQAVRSPSGLFECTHCPYRHRDVQLYRKHIKIHGPRNWQCHYCEKKFHVLDRLRRHCRVAHVDLSFRYVDLSAGAPPPATSSSSSSSTARQQPAVWPDTSQDVRVDVRDVLQLTELQLSRLLSDANVSVIHC